MRNSLQMLKPNCLVAMWNRRLNKNEKTESWMNVIDFINIKQGWKNRKMLTNRIIFEIQSWWLEILKTNQNAL